MGSSFKRRETVERKKVVQWEKRPIARQRRAIGSSIALLTPDPARAASMCSRSKPVRCVEDAMRTFCRLLWAVGFEAKSGSEMLARQDRAQERLGCYEISYSKLYTLLSILTSICPLERVAEDCEVEGS